jgi:hypothetical protein
MTFANEIVGFASVVFSAVFAVTVDTNYILCFETGTHTSRPIGILHRSLPGPYDVCFKGFLKCKKAPLGVTLFCNSVLRCVIELGAGVAPESEKVFHDEAVQRR